MGDQARWKQFAIICSSVRLRIRFRGICPSRQTLSKIARLFGRHLHQRRLLCTVAERTKPVRDGTTARWAKSPILESLVIHMPLRWVLSPSWSTVFVLQIWELEGNATTSAFAEHLPNQLCLHASNFYIHALSLLMIVAVSLRLPRAEILPIPQKLSSRALPFTKAR